MKASAKVKVVRDNPKTHWWYYLVAVIAVICYLLPIYVLVNLSFRTVQTMSQALPIKFPLNLENYLIAFKNKDVWTGFLNSIILCAATVFVEVVVAAIASYGVARSNGKIANSIRTINMLVMMIPGIALLVGTYGLMVKLKLTNSLLGLALLSAAGGIPGTMFMYVNFVIAIPRALDEAASIDGAGVLRTFFQIILPQLRAITITRVIMTAVGSWNNYLMPMFLLNNKAKYTIILVIKAAFAGSNGVKNIPLACATCAVGLLPIIAMYIALQKFIIEGQLDSAVK